MSQSTSPPDEIIDRIYQRTAYAAQQVRHAMATFLGLDAAEVGETDDAPALDAGQLTRYASAWLPLVPTEPAPRALVLDGLQQRSGFTMARVATTGLSPDVSDDESGARNAEVGAGTDTSTTTALLRAIEREITWVPVAKGTILCRQGEPSECMYLVVSGRLRVFVQQTDGTERLVAELRRGDSIGEMGLLSGEVRSATIYASRESELVKLSQEGFNRLVRGSHEFLLQLSRTLVERLRVAQGPPRRPSSLRTIAVLPAGSGHPPIAAFTERLVQALSRIGPTLHVSRARLDEILGPGALDELERDPESGRVRAELNARETAFPFVVYEADPEPSFWTARCSYQADSRLLVGDATGGAELNVVERWLPAPDPHAMLGQALAILHPDRSVLPTGTARWLRPRTVNFHQHVHLGTPSDFDRLARRLAGRAVGLTLGGGGSRGFIHIGVIRALRELGVPIDVIGGTSMGAIIGGLYALEYDFSTVAVLLDQAIATIRPGFDPVLPFVSVTSGRKMTNLLEIFYRGACIEDLWTPFYCVTTNMTTGEAMVHQAGELRKYVRASSSVPGINPPVTENGQLLVDGGILNNLPADVTRALCQDGPVLAVDVSPRAGLVSKLEYGESLGNVRVLLTQLSRRGSTESPVPTMGDILERITMLSSVRQSAQLRADIDLYLHPPTDDINFMDKKISTQVSERGYVYAKPLIEEWRAAWPDAPTW